MGLSERQPYTRYTTLASWLAIPGHCVSFKFSPPVRWYISTQSSRLSRHYPVHWKQNTPTRALTPAGATHLAHWMHDAIPKNCLLLTLRRRRRLLR